MISILNAKAQRTIIEFLGIKVAKPLFVQLDGNRVYVSAESTNKDFESAEVEISRTCVIVHDCGVTVSIVDKQGDSIEIYKKF